jgi:hypothetical protein
MCCRKRGPKLASDGQAFKVFTSHDVEGESKVGRLRVVVADEEDRRATAETEEETKTAWEIWRDDQWGNDDDGFIVFRLGKVDPKQQPDPM